MATQVNDLAWRKIRELQKETSAFQDKAAEALQFSKERGDEIQKAWDKVEETQKEANLMLARAGDVLEKAKKAAEGIVEERK